MFFDKVVRNFRDRAQECTRDERRQRVAADDRCSFRPHTRDGAQIGHTLGILACFRIDYQSYVLNSIRTMVATIHELPRRGLLGNPYPESCIDLVLRVKGYT